MPSIQTQNPLSGKFDRDPGRWRPYKYGTLVEVPVAEGLWGENTIQILNQPFILDRICHSIIGDTNYEDTGLAQDGQYFIEWHEAQSEYQNEPLLARAAYGTAEYSLLLSAPLAFSGDRVLTFRVINAYTRLLTPVAEFFKVQIVLHGLSDWGTDRRS